jgi:hypothetical protein
MLLAPGRLLIDRSQAGGLAAGGKQSGRARGEQGRASRPGERLLWRPDDQQAALMKRVQSRVRLG